MTQSHRVNQRDTTHGPDNHAAQPATTQNDTTLHWAKPLHKATASHCERPEVKAQNRRGPANVAEIAPNTRQRTQQHDAGMHAGTVWLKTTPHQMRCSTCSTAPQRDTCMDMWLTAGPPSMCCMWTHGHSINALRCASVGPGCAQSIAIGRRRCIGLHQQQGPAHQHLSKVGAKPPRLNHKPNQGNTPSGNARNPLAVPTKTKHTSMQQGPLKRIGLTCS